MAAVTRYCNFDLGSGANDGTSEADAWQSWATATAAISTHFGSNPDDTMTVYLKRVATPSTTMYSHNPANDPGSQGCVVFEGYATTPGDGASGPSNWFNHAGVFATLSQHTLVRYFDVDAAIANTSGMLRVENGIVEFCRAAITYASLGPALRIANGVARCCHAIQKSQITSRQASACAIQLDRAKAIGCWSEGPINMSVGFRPCQAIGNLITKGRASPTAGDGVYAYGGASQSGCLTMFNTIYDVPGDGILIEDSWLANSTYVPEFFANVIWGAGGYGIHFTDATETQAFMSIADNFVGNTTSGNLSGEMAETAAVTALTADPFTNAAGGDFSINTAAGGGALIRAARLFDLATWFGLQGANSLAGFRQDAAGGGGGTYAWAS